MPCRLHELGIETGGVAPYRVLLVEDDVDVRELVAEFLRETGYHVDEASDGRQGLDAILRESPSLLITDCNMPSMSGNELVDILVLDEQLRSIPVIVVSARTQAALPLNVIAFLQKPFKLKQLGTAVRNCFAGRVGPS